MKKRQRKPGDYVWADGSRCRVPVDVAAREVKRIEVEEGNATPAAILRRAKDPANPLHPQFDWDNRLAGHRWRLVQAANLILAVRVIATDGRPRRVFANVIRGEGYVSLDRVARNPDLARVLLDRAREELIDWQERYRDLREHVDLLREALQRAKGARHVPSRTRAPRPAPRRRQVARV